LLLPINEDNSIDFGRLSPSEFAELKAQVPALIGIKVLGGDAAWFEEMNQLVPEVSIFVAGHLLAEKVRFGARGSYSNVACLHPRAARDWQRMMKADPDAALELGTRFQGFLADHIAPFLERGYSNQAVDKLLACIGDWTDLTPRLRWPYDFLPATEAARLRPLAKDRLPEFFG
jgi:4-hydroxy-tetrahydrodipicolinate synthase